VAVFGAIWSAFICRGAPALAGLPPGSWTILNFDDLLIDPAGELSSLAAFLQIPASSKWLEDAVRLIDRRRPTSIAAELEPAELAAVRDACAPGTAAVDAAMAQLTTMNS
jgi:hypothetical protein